tara:strand:+ start:914 stop:1090 length:177 start_codon:yes stop_codon:yes gene_type:complete
MTLVISPILAACIQINFFLKLRLLKKEEEKIFSLYLLLSSFPRSFLKKIRIKINGKKK